MRTRARVDATHAMFVDGLRAHGCLVHSTAQLGKGFPDAVVLNPWLEVYLLEFKSPGGSLTDDQTKWFAAGWGKSPMVRVVSTLGQALSAVGIQTDIE